MATIRLTKKNKTIKVVNRKENIKLTNPSENIKLKHTGKPGPKGDKGEQGDPGNPGLGLPDGGTAEDVLVKLSDDDYDTEWRRPGLSDKHFEQTFTVASTVNVNHNLEKYPAVSVTDSTGDEVEGRVNYIDLNNITLEFSGAFSGRVTCN